MIIFAAFQKLLKSAANRDVGRYAFVCVLVRLESTLTDWDRKQSEEFIGMARKLAIDYVNFIKECWVHASVCSLHCNRYVRCNVG